MDFASLALGISDQMGSNLSGLGDDILQKRQTDKANEFNLFMWNLQNRYNDPSQQMARLKAAGLNPNLVYGKGATTLAATPQGYNKPPSPSGKNFDALETYLSAKQAELIPYQVDLTKKQIQNQIVSESISQEKLKQERQKTKNIEDFSWYIEDEKHNNLIWDRVLKQEKYDVIQNQEQIQNLQKRLIEGQIDMNQYEIELNKLGMSKKDPLVYRLLKELFVEMMKQ